MNSIKGVIHSKGQSLSNNKNDSDMMMDIADIESFESF